MVWNLVIKVELAKPAVRKVERYFLAEPTLMTDAIAVSHQQHSDHELGIDRGSTNLAVKRPQLLVQIRQGGCREYIEPPQQVVRRDHIVQVKLVEQLTLIPVLP